MQTNLCEKCSHFKATVHITIIRNGLVTQLHLCQRCKAPERISGEKTCPDCGKSFREIQAIGRFGCARDYEIFESEIVKALEDYHGASVHVGKKPSSHIFSA